MGEDHTSGTRARQILRQRWIIHVEFHAALRHQALDDEEIGAAAGIDQRVCPFRVAGIGDDVALAFEAQRIGRRAGGMRDFERRHTNAVYLVRATGFDLAHVDRELEFALR